MADIQVTKVEQYPNGRSVFSVRVQASAERMEFPIAIQDEGTAGRNEMAVLRGALGFAEDLAHPSVNDSHNCVEFDVRARAPTKLKPLARSTHMKRFIVGLACGLPGKANLRRSGHACFRHARLVSEGCDMASLRSRLALPPRFAPNGAPQVRLSWRAHPFCLASHLKLAS